VELESSKILILSSVIDVGVYLHDPTALLAAVNPSLLTYTEGAVRVQTTGITRGLTLLYDKQKR
jgi:inosine-uridine nucleoside N-ribohydrolase